MKTENNFQLLALCEATNPRALIDALARAGYSNTRARRAVVLALGEIGQATPAELLALGRAHHPALGLVTVYRTLEILDKLGLIRKLHLEEGCHRYALSALAVHQADRGADTAHEDAHIHSHHIICQRCNRAVEFEGCDLETVMVAVETQTGFRVHAHWLEMFGICPECQGA